MFVKAFQLMGKAITKMQGEVIVLRFDGQFPVIF